MISQIFNLTQLKTQRSYLTTLDDHEQSEISRNNLVFEFEPVTEADTDFYDSYKHDVRLHNMNYI
jgi:hypothetical protein